MTFNFVVASVFKNESSILKEWITHYLKHGAEHFYLVNDFSTDNFKEIIHEFGEVVTLYNNDIVTNKVGRQTMIYNKYFKDIPSKWVALLDLDEFMWTPKCNSIKTYLDSIPENINQIKVDWLHFGSSGHIKQPSSVINSFTKRAKFDTTKEYYSYKSIYKSKSLISFNVHGHNVTGMTLHEKYSEQDQSGLVINHYPIQSFEFFMNIKATRGDINNWFNTTGRKRNEEYFKKQDINEIEDTRLKEFNF